MYSKNGGKIEIPYESSCAEMACRMIRRAFSLRSVTLFAALIAT